MSAHQELVEIPDDREQRRGVMALFASLLAGGLWTWSVPTATFVAGAVLAVVTGVMALGMGRPPLRGASAGA